MTDHTLRPFCVCCGAQLPHMTREEALRKGAAFVHNDKTYYQCVGRHTREECLRMIAAVPTFEPARCRNCKIKNPSACNFCKNTPVMIGEPE